MSSKSNRPQHDRSRRIKDFENNNLIQLIEREDGVTLATAVVQLWLSQKPNHTTWNKVTTGIISFVKDYTKKSYFFRLYSLVPNMIWEQEMYTPFSYNQLSKNFHSFASDDCNAGFNFAFDEEAERFYNIVINKIMSKTKRNNTRNTNGTSINQSNPTNTTYNPNATNSMSSTSIHSNPSSHSLNNSNPNQDNQHRKSNTPSFSASSLSNKFSTLKKKNKIDKIQIGAPTNFRVVQHVGLTNNDYEINLTAKDETRQMRDILSAINMSGGVPLNKKTQAFMNNYIQEHGGMEKFDEELKKQKAPAPPAVPVVQSFPSYPNNNGSGNSISSNPTQHSRPAPVPQQYRNNTSVPFHLQQQQIQRPTSAPSVPPPPPPPLPPLPTTTTNYNSPTPPPPPPPPPAPFLSQTQNSSRPALPQFNQQQNMEPLTTNMSSINVNDAQVPNNSGPPAPPPPPPPPPPPMPNFSDAIPSTQMKITTKPRVEPPKPDGRSDLFDSIKGFQFSKGLKPAVVTSESSLSPESSSTNNNPAAPPENSILDQLKNELVKRAQFFNDSEDSEDSDESEWQ